MSDDSFPRTSRDGIERLMLHHHADVVEAAHDPERFSSAVSRHLQVPNGMDGAEHAAYRELLDPFFSPDRMAQLAPVLAAVAKGVVTSIEPGTTFDAVGDLGSRYSVRAQSHWLGWPIELEETLLIWVQENRSASRSVTGLGPSRWPIGSTRLPRPCSQPGRVRNISGTPRPNSCNCADRTDHG